MASDEDGPIRWEFGDRLQTDGKVYWLPFLFVHAGVLLWLWLARAGRKGFRWIFRRQGRDDLRQKPQPQRGGARKPPKLWTIGPQVLAEDDERRGL